MRRLFLLRHAKAVQASGEGDHARALTERGRSDAASMGGAMTARGYIPNAVYCSDAARAMETWSILSRNLTQALDMTVAKALYLASAKSLLSQIQSGPDRVKALMLVGHNPGIGECAIRLARTPTSPAENLRLAKMTGKFSTCALAVLDFDTETWRDADGQGILLDFLEPRDLLD